MSGRFISHLLVKSLARPSPTEVDTPRLVADSNRCRTKTRRSDSYPTTGQVSTVRQADELVK